ncbi:MAG: FAD-binding oxidoreductase [Thermales bacterium]|nr:FAD-binding oxidoreductase [Thermales bacterium]
MLNDSPWIEQLEDINYDQLEKTVDAEVCVVGAGISGCLSAYYILENTQKSVILLDAWKVGQSASGHNAGQVINQFERSAKSIEKEFGTKKVIEARQVIEDSWTRLLEILDKIDLTPQPRIFKGYDAYNSVEQLNNILDDLVVYNKLGQRNFEKLYILKDIHIDHKYAGLYQRIELKKLKDYLDTQRDDFVGALERKTLIMNSALVCQKLIQFLLKVYPKRFRVFEKTEVIRIDLGLQNSFLKCNKGLVNCNKIVLCTNGFENFQINNKNGEDIIKSFHQNIIGKIGLMQGYFSFDYKEEIYSAVSYSPRKGNLKEYEEYIYTTKRRFGEGFC